MSNWQARVVVSSALTVALLAVPGGAWAQEGLSAKLHPSGMIQLFRGNVQLAMIELNAHGREWKQGPQTSGTAKVSDLPDRSGKRFSGTLPVPNTDGGALQFSESVRTIPQGLQLEYELGVTKTLRLNGLQLSIDVPVPLYAGKTLGIGQLENLPLIINLPPEQQDPKAPRIQIWSGESSRIELAKGTPDEVVIELRAVTDVMVQDLRQWNVPNFEVRLPAILEDQGRDILAEDRFHLDLSVTCASPVKLVGP